MGNQSKAIGGGLGGALSTILIWGAESLAAIDIPDSVELAIAVVVGYAVVWLMPANTPAESA